MRTRSLSIALLCGALLAPLTLGALPYCGELYTCSVPPREYCDTLCLECGPDGGPEQDGGTAGSCQNPTVYRVGDIPCPCLESTGLTLDLDALTQEVNPGLLSPLLCN